MNSILKKVIKQTQNIKNLRKIQINEMFMRDGLQSLKTIYDINTKKKFISLLNNCNFESIEFGSTTSAKILPQMANSLELYDSIIKKNNTKYTMLVPNITHLPKAIEHNINSFGFVCSVSNLFALKNLKNTSSNTFDIVKKQLDIVTQKQNMHMRIYLSCSFGSPWEIFDNDYLTILELYIKELIAYSKNKKLTSDDFNIVISDTVGLSTETRTTEIINLLNNNFDKNEKKYFAMHIHSSKNNFIKPIELCINNDIFNFDSSMLGIGGCPFAENHAIGNISTVELIDFLQTNGLCKDYDLKNLKYVENEIKNILNNTH